MNLLYANDAKGTYPPSYYAATATPLDPFPVLAGAQTADVCIVGGGYMGLSAALHLAERGLSVTLIEAHRVGFGASGRNGGQVGSGQRRDQDALERIAGPTPARALWDLGEDAKSLVRDLITRHQMPVTFRPGVAHACWTDAEVHHAHTYAEKLARDYNYPHVEPLDLPAIRQLIGSQAFKGGEIDHGAGHIHPLNFALGLARAAAAAGVRIHEQTEALQIRPGPKPVVLTTSGTVTCDHLILAGNGYIAGLDHRYAARVMPINNFIIATQPLGDRARDILAKPIAVADTKFVVNYWRLSDDNRLLFGGAESYGYRFPDIIKAVTKPMLQIYPQLRDTPIDYAWGGTLAITMNRMPALMRLAPNVLAASACSGHGVAMATMTGRILAETIAGTADRFDLLATLPQARFPGGPALRWPLLVLAMTWYSLRDRLGL
ncbi:MAG: NAD(P)/FAD-dependent oxidoreductase [Paracoccaceae bacterium]